MHHAAITLRTEPVGDAVQHPWERVLEVPDRLRRPLPSEKKVREVFSDVGALLIMGEPGAGKTVTLLELARDLLDRFEADPGQPLPVVLHLSFWREARVSQTNSTPFSIWVEAEMKDKYSVPARRTHAWLAKSRLCLLLDGLDEVRVQERAGCVRAINEFISEVGVSGIAVCSRVTEYVAIGERLRFSGAIRIQPLTEQQIDEYLERAGSGLAALRHEVQKDPVLQDLAGSPLMLSVMTLAYQDLSFEDIVDPSPATVENRRKRVFDRYVARMFQRPWEASASYPEEDAKHWLGWLAARMAEHSSTMFRLEDLQPSWLPSPKQRMAYALSSRLIAAIVTSAPAWAVARMLEPLMVPVLHTSGIINLDGSYMTEVTVETNELKSTLQNINPVLAAGAAVGIVLGLKTSWRFAGRVKDQSPGSGNWRSKAEPFVVTLVIVGVFGVFHALAAPHFESETPWFFWCCCSVIFWPLVSRHLTVANDIRLGGPYRPSFAAALKEVKPAARDNAIGVGGCLIAVVLLWFLIMLFQRDALLRIVTYKDSAFVFLKIALLFAVFGASRAALIGVWGSMGKPTDLPDTARPGQGLSFSLRNAALSGVVAVVSVFLFCAPGFLFLFGQDLYPALLGVTFLSLCIGVLAASGSGGFDAIKHLTLRFLLRRQNLIPRDLSGTKRPPTPATPRPSKRSCACVLSGFLVFGYFDAVHEAGAADDFRELLGCIEPSPAPFPIRIRESSMAFCFGLRQRPYAPSPLIPNIWVPRSAFLPCSILGALTCFIIPICSAFRSVIAIRVSA